MNELEQRRLVVKEAISFIGTPYREGARLKGVGVDCLTYIVEVFQRTGIIPPVDIPPYSPQWHHHRNTELYLQGVKKYSHEVEAPQPGDIAMWKFGRCFAHAGIVIEWPRIVHSVKGIGVHEEDASISSLLRFDNGKPREMKYFSFWGA